MCLYIYKRIYCPKKMGEIARYLYFLDRGFQKITSTLNNILLVAFTWPLNCSVFVWSRFPFFIFSSQHENAVLQLFHNNLPNKQDWIIRSHTSTHTHKGGNIWHNVQPLAFASFTCVRAKVFEHVKQRERFHLCSETNWIREQRLTRL